MKPKSKNKLLKLSKAGGSRVALDSFDRPGGLMGKEGKAKHKAQRQALKLELRGNYEYED